MAQSMLVRYYLTIWNYKIYIRFNGLTIIIPFLDEDSSLKKLLDSLIHSKENIFEIIIINTGTHDLKNLVDHKYFSFFKINIQNRPIYFLVRQETKEFHWSNLNLLVF